MMAVGGLSDEVYVVVAGDRGVGWVADVSETASEKRSSSGKWECQSEEKKRSLAKRAE
jgi:hypothetical protein